ncbi:MAG: hypothetical protein ABIS17_10245 [Casimicrobiaceae bacterium]
MAEPVEEAAPIDRRDPTPPSATQVMNRFRSTFMEIYQAPNESIRTAQGVPMTTRVWRIVTLGDRLSRRVALVAWSATGVGLGLFFGWNWLVAAGLSSVVLGILPCAAMCAAGVCASGGGKCAGPNAKSKPD